MLVFGLVFWLFWFGDDLLDLIKKSKKSSTPYDEISEEDLVSEAEDTLTILSKYINELDYSVDKKQLDKGFDAFKKSNLSIGAIIKILDCSSFNSL